LSKTDRINGTRCDRQNRRVFRAAFLNVTLYASNYPGNLGRRTFLPSNQSQRQNSGPWGEDGNQLAIRAPAGGLAAIFLTGFIRGWNPPSTQPRPIAVKEAEPGDPVLGPAKNQVYGVLASSDPGAPESSDAEPAPRPRAPAAIDHIVAAPAFAPARFLHKRFSVTKFEGFELFIPAHTFHPKVHGTFKSIAPGGGGREAAEINVLLLNEDEFGAFARGEDVTGRFSTEACVRGEVDWALNSPIEAQRYYLIFNAASSRPRNKIVDADFTISSE
jgi:hypothetical protein